MLLFISKLMAVLKEMSNFNTSHVTVYLIRSSNSAAVCSFQYISCYCLSDCICRSYEARGISIHLMLLFIGYVKSTNSEQKIFQYISCYCLSCYTICFYKMCTTFQYISCYCLSKYLSVIRICSLSFQYISCYCLSFFMSFNICYNNISIHLMLLFIDDGRYYRRTRIIISIHLMLLFISLHGNIYNREKIFQYISCYCLSQFWDVSNPSNIFQYISCYCLSILIRVIGAQ